MRKMDLANLLAETSLYKGAPGEDGNIGINPWVRYGSEADLLKAA